MQVGGEATYRAFDPLERFRYKGPQLFGQYFDSDVLPEAKENEYYHERFNLLGKKKGGRS